MMYYKEEGWSTKGSFNTRSSPSQRNQGKFHLGKRAGEQKGLEEIHYRFPGPLGWKVSRQRKAQCLRTGKEYRDRRRGSRAGGEGAREVG